MPDLIHLHPMIVHFPIALLFIGFFSDVAGIALKREFFNKVGLLLLMLGTIGVIAAYISGSRAGEGLAEAGALKMALDTHEDAAEFTLWLVTATVIMRAGLVILGKHTGALRLVPLGLFLIGILSIARTGYYGGELVFKHAAGVQLDLGFGAANAAPEPQTLVSPAESEDRN